MAQPEDVAIFVLIGDRRDSSQFWPRWERAVRLAEVPWMGYGVERRVVTPGDRLWRITHVATEYRSGALFRIPVDDVIEVGGGQTLVFALQAPPRRYGLSARIA